jgi:hypothetical protein
MTHHCAAQPLATRLFELAGLIFLMAIGLAVNAVGAWLVIAMPMAAIVVLLLSDLEAGRSGAAGSSGRDAGGAGVDRAPDPSGT